MMKAEIKRIHSPDIDSLSTYSPGDPESFSFLLQAFVGPKDTEGEESFCIQVCTPKWLNENYNQEDVIIGRHLLIVLNYNYDRILNRIKEYVRSCSGKTWKEVAEKIGRIGRWEFEDYSESGD